MKLADVGMVIGSPVSAAVWSSEQVKKPERELPTLVDRYVGKRSVVDPGVLFAVITFLMVLLAENARIPIDNPTTNHERTTIHQACSGISLSRKPA